MSGIVWAENRDEARDLIDNRDTEEECFDDSDSDDYNYNFDEASIELEEGSEDDEEEYNEDEDSHILSEIPAYFLEKILFI
jgi:hypothetical protein